MGFFGALRGSEYLTPSASAYSPRRTCLRRHVTTDNDALTLTIPASKTDQTGKGHVVTLPRLQGSACPVRAMDRYLAYTGHLPADLPLFTLASGSYATISWLNNLLKTNLCSASGKLTTHSLRIGFATAAAATGTPNQTIQASGRWQGHTYASYIRGPRLDVRRACLAIDAAHRRDRRSH
ncbi:uncharacterized protein LOC122393162 [Amphibalanus amphitrite]|uniref:uncharacterized protein LOC122393162 n=1 Tax=Amphibalanus amphitrite TaxID=1232801 RepID=UPI001C92170A|nr:uncharacterized protein LOC122393162 [Amphibalanus amphitrite]